MNRLDQPTPCKLTQPTPCKLAQLNLDKLAQPNLAKLAQPNLVKPANPDKSNFDLKKFIETGKRSRETVIRFSRRIMDKANNKLS